MVSFLCFGQFSIVKQLRNMITINLIKCLFLIVITINRSYQLSVDNLIIGVIIDEADTTIKKSVTAAINSLSTLFTIDKVKWIEGDSRLTGLEVNCDWISSRFNNSIPTIIFDLTEAKESKLSTAIKSYSRQLGIPTISTNPSTIKTNSWDNLNHNEINYLITINSPGDVIPMIIPDIINLHNINEAIILHDQSFVIDDKLINILDEIQVDYKIKRLTIDSLDEQMIELRGSSVKNYFVLAKIININRILEQAAHLGMFKFQDSWFMITKGRGQIKCDNCSHGSILFYQPSRVKSIEYDHAPGLLNITNERRVDGFFIYDLIRFTLTSVHQMIKANTWKTLSYPSCGHSLTLTQTNERKNLNLRDTMSSEGFYGLFGQFIVSPESSNELSSSHSDHIIDYQEIIVRVTKIELWNWQPFRYYLVSEWIAEPPRGRFMMTGAIQAAKRPLYRIVTIKQPPFVMRWSNGTWYGYCIDLLELIVEKLPEEDKFDYEIYECPDGKYGDKDLATGRWDGIMGQLQDKRAEIGIGSVTVMAERESIVDFTVPYYDLVGVSILMKRTATPSHMFKFLTVLTNNVWLSVLICYIVTSVVMYLFDRLSPYSYHNAVERGKALDANRDFNLKECLWFCMTSLTPQGGGEAPVNLSGRLLAACWWIFGFVLIATYTANLAAFLTVSRLDSPIDGLDKLVEQYRIRYSPVRNSLSMVYFERMAYIERKFYEIWRDMTLDEQMDPKERAKLTVWDYPLSQKYSNILKQIKITGMPETFEEGVARVQSSKSSAEGFALLADATKIRYAAMINCDIHQVGNEFSRKPIALAVQENSELKDKLSSAILKLLNQRQLESLKEKWWNNNPEQKNCEDPKKSSDGISIKNIGGVFIVISVGVVLACITLVWEHCITPRFRKSSARVSSTFRNEFIQKKSPNFYNFPMALDPKIKDKI